MSKQVFINPTDSSHVIENLNIESKLQLAFIQGSITCGSCKQPVGPTDGPTIGPQFSKFPVFFRFFSKENCFNGKHIFFRSCSFDDKNDF